MAIYRKKKFTSPKEVVRPEIGAAHKSQKVGGPWPARPNRLRHQCCFSIDSERQHHCYDIWSNYSSHWIFPILHNVLGDAQ